MHYLTRMIVKDAESYLEARRLADEWLSQYGSAVTDWWDIRGGRWEKEEACNIIPATKNEFYSEIESALESQRREILYYKNQLDSDLSSYTPGNSMKNYYLVEYAQLIYGDPKYNSFLIDCEYNSSFVDDERIAEIKSKPDKYHLVLVDTHY